MSEDEKLVARRRSLDRRTMAAISPLPPPEEIFIDWLMSVPFDVDLEMAARRQIDLIDKNHILHPDVLRLRLLLAAVANGGEWHKPSSNL